MKRLAKSATPTFVLCIALSISSVTHAQNGSCLLNVQMSLVNHTGQFVTTLDPSQFRASYRGKPVRILSAVMQQRTPRRVLILIDVSGSMQSIHTLDFDVADELLDQFPQGTQVAAMVAAKDSAPTIMFTTDHQSVRNQLRVFRDDRHLTKTLKRMSALFDAIERSLLAFGAPREGDTLYVISDGEDNASNIKWRKLDQELLQRGTRVFAMRIRWTGIVGLGEGNLPDLITATGGSTVVLPLDYVRYGDLPFEQTLRDPAGKKSLLALQIDMQARLMLNLDTLKIELSQSPRGKDKLELRLAKPSNDVFLVYQHSLPPCVGSSAEK